jgi:homoserine O-acetyltransferase
MAGFQWQSDRPFLTESGEVLPSLTVHYHTYGALNKEKNNVIWVTHALTGNADAADWWAGLVGPGKCFDPEHYFIVCANNLGSCYGTSGPLTMNPLTGAPYYSNFPFITIKDQVQAHKWLAEALDIRQIFIGIGGSMGGQQMVQWAVDEPSRFLHLILLATNARHSPWGIALNETQRMALQADPGFFNPDMPDAGKAGLEAARAIGMISYRHYSTYARTQAETSGSNTIDHFRAASYQKYQGLKLWKRFNPWSYFTLSKAMDSHDVGRNAGGVEKALGEIKSKTFVIGIKTDILFPIAEQELLAKYIKGASFFEIDSVYGHDGFLVEFKQITILIDAFLTGKEYLAPLPVFEPPFYNTALPGSESF